MIRRIDLRGRGADDPVDYRRVVPRAATDVEATLDVVRPIVDDVRDRGLEAVLEYSARFDGVTQDDVVVPREARVEALRRLDPDVRRGLEVAIERLRTTSRAELHGDTVTDVQVLHDALDSNGASATVTPTRRSRTVW